MRPVFSLHSAHRNPLAALGVAVVLSVASLAAPAEKGASSKPSAFVILVDGTRIAAARVERSGSTVVVTMADGSTVTYDASQVAVQSAGRAKATTGSQAEAGKPASSLGGFASSITLAVPEEGGPLRGATIGSATPSRGTEEDGSASNDPLVDAETPAGPDQLDAAIAQLAARWKGFNGNVSEVDARCSDYSYATGPGGRSIVIHNSYTAPCQDAVRRANVELDALAARHTELQQQARKTGMTPGQRRDLFAKHGLAGFAQQIAGARQRIAVGDTGAAREP